MTPVAGTTPRVRVVVVDYDGGDLTLRCLAALTRTEWDADALEIVVVDNGSSVSVAEQVRAELPRVRIVRSATNRGFAGGNNLALGDLDDFDFVALVNNDVTVEPGWLHPLVTALVDDERLGAAGPKVLFEDRYRRLELSTAADAGGRLERRALGVRVSGVRVADDDRWSGTRFASGTWGPEWGPTGPFHWTTGDATILVPVARDTSDPATCALRLDAPKPSEVVLTSDGDTLRATVADEPRWYPAPTSGPPFDVINSTGTEMTRDGHGIDRGYLEEDRGQYDTDTDMFGWYGGAVLLRTSYLDDIGPLDERLFLYYEDLELSLRGREAGWRYRYVPASVVRHRHAATSSRRWRDAAFYTERNRLLVLARHAGGATATKAAARFAATTLSYAWRDLVAPVGRGERPRPDYVVARARALGSFLAAAPGMLRSRTHSRSTLKRAPSVDR